MGAYEIYVAKLLLNLELLSLSDSSSTKVGLVSRPEVFASVISGD